MRQIDRVLHKLYSLAQWIRGAMPSWDSGKIRFLDSNDELWAEFLITVFPKGIRRVPGLQSCLPFVTSQNPDFAFEVNRTSAREPEQQFSVAVCEKIPHDPNVMEEPITPVVCVGNTYRGHFKGSKIMRKGHHVYVVYIFLGYGRQSFEVLTFYPKDIDSVSMWAVSILAGLIGGGLAGSLLTWWLTK